MNKEKKKIGKLIVILSLVAGLAVGGFAHILDHNETEVEPGYTELPFEYEHKDEADMDWHTIATVTFTEMGAKVKYLVPLGENDPGAATGGWMSMFLLDYGEAPGTVLQNNATDWSTSETAHAYADADDWNEDTPSEDPFYPSVRAKFNKTQCWDVDKFIDTRCRVKLTVTGDETISGVYGTAVVSYNDTNSQCIFINYYWDDEVDGYRVLDDGAFTVTEISIEAKY